MVYCFAAGTSPLRPDEYCWDSAIFQAVGKLWASGSLPYRDIFDHKGPLLFLIQKIAYHFPNPRLALYTIESLFMGVSLCLCRRILQMNLSRVWAFAGTLVMAIFWIPVMEYGNLSETYSMPLVLLPMWLQLNHLHSQKTEHPYWKATVYGLCFGSVFMIRPNNGLLIAVITFVITIQLLIHKRWTNILYNALALITGVLLAILPFVAYFAANNALKEMIYANWQFNLIYASNLQFSMTWQNFRSVLFFITPAVLCLFLALCSFAKRKVLLGAINGLSALAILATTISGVGYAHYFMLHVPLIPLAFFTASCLIKETRSGKWFIILACLCFCILSIRTTIQVFPNAWVEPPTTEELEYEEEYDRTIHTVISHIPSNERDRVAIYGLPASDAEWIIKTDLRPLGRYCFLTEWHAQADPSIIQQYSAFLRSGRAKWLLVRGDVIASPEILDAIASCYQLHTSSNDHEASYMLYQSIIP